MSHQLRADIHLAILLLEDCRRVLLILLLARRSQGSEERVVFSLGLGAIT